MEPLDVMEDFTRSEPEIEAERETVRFDPERRFFEMIEPTETSEPETEALPETMRNEPLSAFFV